MGIETKISVTIREDDHNDIQKIYTHLFLLEELKVDYEDYLQLVLPDGSSVVARPSLHLHGSLVEENIHYYCTTCSDCVSINYSQNKNDTNFLIDLNNIKVLKKSAIDKIRIDLVMSSVDGVLKVMKNKTGFLSILQDFLSLYGVVNGCEIKCGPNIDFRILCIETIKVREVEMHRCSKQNPNNTKENNSDNINCSYVGVGFTCPNDEGTTENLNCYSNCYSECDPVFSEEYNNQAAESFFSNGRICVYNVESVQCQARRVKDTLCLGGMEEDSEQLLKLVQQFHRSSNTNARNGGVLVSGPRGCGKVSLVRGVCARTNMVLVTVQCEHLAAAPAQTAMDTLSKRFTEAEELSRERACLLLLRNIHSLCPDHTAHTLSFMQRAIVNMVVERVYECNKAGVVVVATASNHLHVFADLFDLGHLPYHLPVGASTQRYRSGVLSVLCQGLEEEDREEVAKLTPGFVGADLKQAVEAAARLLSKQEEQQGPNIEHSNVSSRSSMTLKQALLTSVRAIQPALCRGLPFLGERPVVTGVAGVEDVRRQLDQLVTHLTDLGPQYRRLGLTVPRGVLLYGPPGCGKTQMVCGLAEARGCSFLLVQPKHIVSAYVGETERNLAAVFHAARSARPAIIFFDEMDGLFGGLRGSGESSSVRRALLTELLTTMDGGVAGEDGEAYMDGVLVCGSTNNPWNLDPALLRPGRMDRLLLVALPDEEERLQILKLKCEHGVLETPETLQEIARKTHGHTGADLEAIVTQACQEAIERGELTNEDEDVLLTSANLLNSLASKAPTVSPECMARYLAFRDSH